MRYAIFGMMLFFAAPVGATDFSTRQGCLTNLSSEITIADAWDDKRSYLETKMAEAPKTGAEHIARALKGYTDIARISHEIVDDLVKLCASY